MLTRVVALRVRFGRLGLLGLVLCGVAGPARAQTPPTADPAENAPIKVGPFYLRPLVGLPVIGVDTNVFNSPDDPKRDLTVTVVPVLDFGFRAGPARLTASERAEYVWYREYTSERSLNGQLSGLFELRYTRIRPYASAALSRSRARQGEEIDARAYRSQPVYVGGVDLAIASRTWIQAEYQHASTTFDQGEVYQGVDLGAALNNTTKTASASLRFDLTPLTTLALVGQVQRARFDVSTFRNNNSYAFLTKLAFDPEALLSGTAAVGYRRLQGLSPEMPDYRGPIAAAGLAYTLLSSTRFAVGVDRDVVYSFENEFPYYVRSAVNASVTQRLIGQFEVRTLGRRAWLDYKPLVGAAGGRTDRADDYGAGLGYRFGPNARIGFDVERVERRSEVASRQYQGRRYYGSMTYGF